MSAVKVKKNEEQQAKSDVPKVAVEDDDDKETGCCLWLPSSNILPSSLTALAMNKLFEML